MSIHHHNSYPPKRKGDDGYVPTIVEAGLPAGCASCSAGYAVSYKGAKLLKQINTPTIFKADHLFTIATTHFNAKTYFVTPALAWQSSFRSEKTSNDAERRKIKKKAVEEAEKTKKQQR